MNHEAANVEMVEEAKNLAWNVLTGNRSTEMERSFGVAFVSQQCIGRVSRTMGRRMPTHRGALSQLSGLRGLAG
jgi:hypothetical protein